MPAPNDLNSRIALRKGWTWYEKPQVFVDRFGARWSTRHWRNPEGKPAMRPDFVGTLEGVSGMLREMLECSADVYLWAPQMTGWMCVNTDWSQCWGSDVGRPGDCVGDAWLSVKEAADAS